MNKPAELAEMLKTVDQLAAAMKAKLRAKAREGYRGGLKPDSHYEVAKRLQEHTERLTGICPACKSSDGEHDREDSARQAIDVANLAMMLWHMGGKPR